MIAPDETERLLAEIATAEHGDDIVDLLVLNANGIAELPSQQREHVNERIADIIRERRQKEAEELKSFLAR